MKYLCNMESYRNIQVVMPKDAAALNGKKGSGKKPHQNQVKGENNTTRTKDVAAQSSNGESRKMLHRDNVETEEPDNITRIMIESFDFINIFGALLGWRHSYELKPNVRFWLTLTLLTFTWINIFHSQLTYVKNGEHRRIFEVFSMYGIALACVLRVRCFFKYHKEMMALYSFTNKITRLACKDSAHQLERRLLSNFRTLKLTVLIEVPAFFVFVYNPLKSFIINHELVPLLPIDIVFVDRTELSGFLIANCIMTAMGLYAIFGSWFMTMTFYDIILKYSIQVDLIESDVRLLDHLWGKTTTSTLLERYSLLRNICQKCQDKDNYIAEMKKIFDQTIYLYFGAVYISQIICLYEIEMENWMSGYGIAYGMFIEMLLQCLFGTKATITNERLYYILTQSDWYTYDVPSQKTFLILLSSCMNNKDLWIGPLAPLSVITGIQILKSIYTYYTFLTEAM